MGGLFNVLHLGWKFYLKEDGRFLMKVCVLAPENSPSWGGVGNYVYNLVKNLPSHYEKHIVTINRNISDSYDKLLQNENCYVHNILDVTTNDSFFYNLKFQIAILRKLKNLDEKYDFNIIHSHSGHLPHLFSQFQDIAPLVTTVHSTSLGMDSNIKQYKTEKSETEKYMSMFLSYIKFYEKIGFEKVDRLLPVSKFTLDEIINLYKVDVLSKSTVVLNATDSEMFRPGVQKNLDEIVIAFIGRFYAIKGFHIFLDAMKNIIEKGYKIKPYLVGRGNKELTDSYLKTFSSDYLLSNLVPYNKMPGIYNFADIVVVPSLYENCPSVVLEAMSSGKIVIASNVGGIPEIIQHEKNGLLFEKGNAVDLENKIIAILERTYDVDKIRNNARETIINHFQWKEKIKDICQVYQTEME
jgi:glycosyltransferase involved in cell wall biosynthesis